MQIADMMFKAWTNFSLGHDPPRSDWVQFREAGEAYMTVTKDESSTTENYYWIGDDQFGPQIGFEQWNCDIFDAISFENGDLLPPPPVGLIEPWYSQLLNGWLPKIVMWAVSQHPWLLVAMIIGVVIAVIRCCLYGCVGVPPRKPSSSSVAVKIKTKPE